MKEGICKDAERQKSEIHEKNIFLPFIFFLKKKKLQIEVLKRDITPLVAWSLILISSIL